MIDPAVIRDFPAVSNMKPSPSSFSYNMHLRREDICRENQGRAGQFVAYSIDGRETYCFADTLPALLEKLLKEHGKTKSQAVLKVVEEEGVVTVR